MYHRSDVLHYSTYYSISQVIIRPSKIINKTVCQYLFEIWFYYFFFHLIAHYSLISK